MEKINPNMGKNTPRRPPDGRYASAFTLIEMLVVVAIISIVLGFAAPSINSIMRGSKLTQSAQLVRDQLGYARQLALSKNHAVEVRFYRMADIEAPGENAADEAAKKFRAFQCFEILDSGESTPVTKVFKLLGSTVIIDSGQTLSTIIGKATEVGSVPSLNKGTTLKISIPGAGLNYDAVAFRFQPDGTTTLPPQASAQRWYITLHDAVHGDNMDSPPPNFVTLQINPSNGKIHTYHP